MENNLAGIYIHIPYCKTKCNYCDFYSVINKSNEKQFLQAILNEILLQQHFFLPGTKLSSIYFGGGTPSFIEKNHIENILSQIHQVFAVVPNAEITLEANPDDLSFDSLSDYKRMGFNRLSMGVQSLIPDQLRFMQRRHTVQQAQESVNSALKVGFDNISIDLIYGLPELKISEWEASLNSAMQWPVSHLSAYHLTVEEGTLLHKQVKSGLISVISDELSYQQFEILMDLASKHGFEQYEISNFARNSKYSQHNSAYWHQKPYLGLGPSAHSYNLDKRCWNPPNLNTYIKKLIADILTFECEELSILDKFNDMIITSLRTSHGLSLEPLFSIFNPGTKWLEKLQKMVAEGWIINEKEHYRLSRKGIHLGDNLMANLMIVND
jgi:oxygen-independent coproporphyrinogen-3 oxidase